MPVRPAASLSLELGQDDLAHIVYRLRHVVGELIYQRWREGPLRGQSKLLSKIAKCMQALR